MVNACKSKTETGGPKVEILLQETEGNLYGCGTWVCVWCFFEVRSHTVWSPASASGARTGVSLQALRQKTFILYPHCFSNTIYFPFPVMVG